MIITCPNCRTRYQIPPASLGERGRSVRCSNCGNRWFVEPATAPAATPPGAATPPEDAPPILERPPEPEPPTPLAAPPPVATGAPKTVGNGLGAWLLVALVALLLIAAVVGRNEIVSAFPSALPVYRHLGLPVTLRLGLEFANLASARRDENGTPTLLISGEIRNVAGREVEVPKLRVALLDERHQEIRSGFFDPPQATLPPDGSARFEIRLANPPADARDFTISFADQP